MRTRQLNDSINSPTNCAPWPAPSQRAPPRHWSRCCVVRTRHVLGKPVAPTLQNGWNHDNVKRKAKTIERELTQENPDNRRFFQKAWKDESIARLEYRAAQGVAILGVGGVAGLGWDTYRQFAVAGQMWNDPTLDGSPLPYLQTGVALGRAGQLTTLGTSSSATFMRLPTTGWVRAAGAAFLPVTFGVEGTLLAIQRITSTTWAV